MTAWEWSATGTRWRIHHSGGVDADAARAAAAAVEADEQRWSRFRDDSEISRLNRSAGAWTRVSAETYDLLAACVRWHELTGGVFQALVGRALSDWGYARSLAERPAGAERSPAPGPLTETIALDEATRRVRLPRDTAVDTGGIGKAWIAARAARVLADRSQGDALVDAGGDLLAARGSHIVAVEGTDEHLALPAGWGVATSGPDRRRWTNADGTTAHHLIDPATGAPGAQAVRATVAAADLVAADVWAKVLALRPGTVDEIALPAVVTTPGGARPNAAWRALTTSRERFFGTFASR